MFVTPLEAYVAVIFGCRSNNSGVGNKAAYLMTDGSVNESGGQFNGRVVVGLGLTKVANIFYEVQTNLLTSGADYLDLYNALYQACQNLVGQSGIAASDCQQVRNATEAVEMQLQPLAGYNPEAAVCSAGQIARSLYPKNYNGFELSTDFSGVPGWTRQLDFAREGTFSLFGKGSGSFLIDQSVQFTEAVTLPPNAYLRFEHAFEFEATGTTFYDGGAVGYRVNGGPFTPLASPTDGAGYTGVISSLGGNPLAGKSAFSGSSHGYVSTRFDLSSLAGSSVNLGWRIGTDSTVQSKGWWLDNLQLYTCQPGFVLSYSKTGSGSGSVTSSHEGINACSLPCNSGYESGAIVTLTATSASRSRFLGWSGACTGIGTCVVTMDGAKNVTANFTFSPLPDDGFPGSTNLPAGWTQPSGSNATWFATNTAAFAGAQSLRSGVIGNNQNSDISFVGNFAAGNISFARKVSSEQGYDFLVFYVDGVLKAQWSGESDWIEVSFPIAAGAHTFLWRYIKDSILSSGSDAAWIDAVVLPLQLSVSTTSLGSSLNPSVFGQAVSITATVSGSLVTPIGTVAFVDGPNVIAGCASVPVTNGVAQCVTTSLSNGVHSITGQYSGNTTYGSSTSSVLTQTVIGVFPLIPLFMLLL